MLIKVIYHGIVFFFIYSKYSLLYNTLPHALVTPCRRSVTLQALYRQHAKSWTGVIPTPVSTVVDVSKTHRNSFATVRELATLGLSAILVSCLLLSLILNFVVQSLGFIFNVQLKRSLCYVYFLQIFILTPNVL